MSDKKGSLRILLLSALASLICSSAAAFQIDGVPFFRQERHKCGSASLSSILAYYKADIDEARILEETYTEALEGSLLSDLENYARKAGFKTRSGQGAEYILKESIHAGKPVIVLLDVGVWKAAKPHYIVVFGYNGQGFIAHDGKKDSVVFKYARFDKMWKKMGRSYLIIHP